jgi:hypothetical protein
VELQHNNSVTLTTNLPYNQSILATVSLLFQLTVFVSQNHAASRQLVFRPLSAVSCGFLLKPYVAQEV